MDCPRDRTALVSKEHPAKVTIDECPQCGGIWLDEGELNVLERRRDRDSDAMHSQLAETFERAGLATEMSRQLSERAGPCPRCGGTLAPEQYAYSSQIAIDRCANGCGVWLDKGELQAIEAYFEQARRDAKSNPHTAEEDLVTRLEGFWLSLRGGFKKKSGGAVKKR